MQEKQEFFAQAAEEDNDELMDELDDLVAADIEENELAGVGPSNVPIAAAGEANPVAAQAAPAPA